MNLRQWKVVRRRKHVMTLSLYNFTFLRKFPSLIPTKKRRFKYLILILFTIRFPLSLYSSAEKKIEFRTVGILNVMSSSSALFFVVFRAFFPLPFQDYSSSPLRLKAFRLFQIQNKVAWNIYQHWRGAHLFFMHQYIRRNGTNKAWNAFRSIEAQMNFSAARMRANCAIRLWCKHQLDALLLSNLEPRRTSKILLFNLCQCRDWWISRSIFSCLSPTKYYCYRK